MSMVLRAGEEIKEKGARLSEDKDDVGISEECVDIPRVGR